MTIIDYNCHVIEGVRFESHIETTDFICFVNPFVFGFVGVFTSQSSGG